MYNLAVPDGCAKRRDEEVGGSRSKEGARGERREGREKGRTIGRGSTLREPPELESPAYLRRRSAVHCKDCFLIDTVDCQRKRERAMRESAKAWWKREDTEEKEDPAGAATSTAAWIPSPWWNGSPSPPVCGGACIVDIVAEFSAH